MKYLDWVKEIYFWQYQENTGSFCWYLIMTYRKADANNKKLLAKAYPDLAAAMHDWSIADNYGDDLFKKHEKVN